MTKSSLEAQSKTIRWGVLGAARITAKVAPAMARATGSTIHGIAARDSSRAAQWAQTFGAAKTYSSYEELLDDPQIDAVYIPLPPGLHHEWTIKAAEKRKHVLCEKPLALSAAQAREMWEACREHNVQFMDGVMWHHHPRKQAMLDVIGSGQLGELRRVTSAFTFCWPQRPDPADELRLQRGMGGGSHYDLGWYNVGATILAFGGLPERVWATARWFNDVDMNLTAVLWYPDQKMASFDNGFDTVKRQWLEVCGTERSLVCDDFVLPHPHLEKHRFWVHDSDGRGVTHEIPKVDQITLMIEDFCQAIRSGKLNHDWPELSIQVQHVCDTILDSARQEQPIDVKPLP